MPRGRSEGITFGAASPWPSFLLPFLTMNQRILLAALLGGLALFAWESVAHLMTPLGEMGFKTLDDEATVLPVLKTTVHDSGLYFFPAPQYRAGMSSAEKSAAMDA